MFESMRKNYHKGVGPGGIGCPCCNPYNTHPRNMKHKVRRVNRRKAKQNIKKEIEQASYDTVHPREIRSYSGE